MQVAACTPAPRSHTSCVSEGTGSATTDKLRGHMDAAEYKHVVLGLIFLKYIPDAFQDKFDDLKARQRTDYTDPEDRDEYPGPYILRRTDSGHPAADLTSAREVPKRLMPPASS